MIPTLIVTGAGLLISVAAWRWHGRQMLPGRPHVVALELAGSGQRMLELLAALGGEGRTRRRRALDIDGWIILGYVLLLGGGTVLSIEAIQLAAEGGWRTVGTTLAVLVCGAVVVAAALDLVENKALGDALSAWAEPPAQAVPPTLANAAERQAHRRRLTLALEAPSARSARAATAKFTILAIVIPAWLLVVLTIIVTHGLG